MTVTVAAAVTGAEGAPLDLHEGISTNWLSRGCERWPAGMRLMWRREAEFGFVKGRCRATNLCPYCRILGVVETAEMLHLDAIENAPVLWIVLTAREHLSRSDTYVPLRDCLKAVRRRWPAAEWFVQVEFQKRGALHLNLLIKGVPRHDGEPLLDAVSGVWCRRVDAEPVGQHVEPLSASEAVVRYLQKELVHGLKSEQAPPIGWKGHRTSQTRGYLVRPASVMREEARQSLRRKRAVRLAVDALESREDGSTAPLSSRQLERLVAEILAANAERSWSLAAEHGGDLIEIAGTDSRPLVGRERVAFDAHLRTPEVSP